MTVTHRKRKLTSTDRGEGGIKYHCDICKRDITDVLRIRCAHDKCKEFDLCVECFSKGAEEGAHKRSHPYRILDKYAFPILDLDWSADEEILLLEAIESVGLGNWADIADHVGTKSLEECRDHYIKYYLETPTYPLPDLSNRLDDDAVNQARKKRQTSPSRKPVNVIPPLKAKVMPSHPANHIIHGYMPGRKEFEMEAENEAEVPIKDMVFNEDDSPTEVDLKVTMLEIYCSKLDRREERKHFIFDRDLIDFKRIQAVERKKSKEERDILNQTRPLARLVSADDYNNFVAGLLAEQKIRLRIEQLQEYRRSGITTLADAEVYEHKKKARLAAVARSPFALTSDRLTAKHLNRMSVQTTPAPTATLPPAPPSSSISNSSATPKNRTMQQPLPLDLSGCDGVEVLTASEQALCSALRILPRAYLSIKETILRECERRGGLKRRETRDLIRIDVNKLGKVYDFFVSKGWVRSRGLDSPDK